MKRITNRLVHTLFIPLVALLLGGCLDLGSELEVRTFQLEHLDPGAAMGLIDPYVYRDREETPGGMSAAEGGITVRETRDNLDRIARVLAQFDEPTEDVRLHFQLIEADGFTDADERIAAVETELRKIFQFRGYRLAGEAYVVAANRSDVNQTLRAGDTLYQITAEVHRPAPSSIRLQEVSLWSEASGRELTTTVTVRPGQTLVLGSSPQNGSTATLLLTVRAEEGGGPS